MFFEAVIISFVILYCVFFYYENYTGGIRAPGPLQIPPFGNLIQIGLEHKITYIALRNLAKKYGDVMKIKLGLQETLIFSSYEAFKHVYAQEESYGRACVGFMWDRNLRQNIGLGMCEGPVWTEARAFCRDSLRNYGFGSRETMKNLLLDELLEFFKIIETDSDSNPKRRVYFDSNYFHPIFINIMATLVLGKRFNYDDKEFQNLLEHEHNSMKNGAIGAGIMMAYPFLRYIFPETLGYNVQMKGFTGYHTAAKNYLKERRTENYRENPRCFTDDFLRKMDEESSNKNSVYTEDHFAVCFLDLFQGGTDTTTSVVNFTLLQLIVNPVIQEKVYHEISKIVGNCRLPNLEDKLRMPYTQAVLLEGLRWSRVGVFGVPRKALEDFSYRNYEIKKGTVLMFNTYSVHFDELWGDPHVFRPERYLDPDGNIDAIKQEKILSFSFSTGKRNCFGEAMARDNIFMFITTLFQNFKFVLPPGEKPSLEPIIGISLYAAPYSAYVRHR